MRILLVGAERGLIDRVRQSFAARGHPVDVTTCLEDVELLRRTIEFNLVIVDLALPALPARDPLARFPRTPPVPLLALARTDSAEERVAALNGGADDCVGRPISIAEVEARAAALVRRGTVTDGVRLNLGDVTLDTAARTVRVADRFLDLPKREFCLLEALLLRPGRVFTKRALFDRIFDSDSEAGVAALELYVHRLRRKLGSSSVQIRTVRNVGYAIDASDRLGAGGLA